MQKEKEQQDKLKAVKARLLYGDESRRNPRNHEESRYSESKTPPAQTEPERRHGRKHSRSPSLVASVFRRLKQNRSPLPGLRPWKEGGVFTRLGRKEPGAYTRSDSHHQSFQTKGAEAPPRKHHHEGTSSRTGYYWPTMHMDARKLIRECNNCQVHRPVPRNPQQNLNPITSPWPFYKWGIDIAGPFPEGPGKVKFLIVAIDYFTKWIEAKPVATITGNQVKKFVWDNIVCRFGLPGEIISDNGKQFRDNPFKDWCEKLCIRQCFVFVKHPQTNGLVERANRSLGEGIKARLDERSKDWIGELSHVLWSHRIMIKSSNRETPFSLTYGKEAVIPAEIGMPTLQTMEVDSTKNDEALEVNLDLIEEKREQAAIQEAKKQN
ncbi:reverse transcriptase domain-containing protein [Tanacetum coccineum]